MILEKYCELVLAPGITPTFFLTHHAWPPAMPIAVNVIPCLLCRTLGACFHCLVLMLCLGSPSKVSGIEGNHPQVQVPLPFFRQISV